MFIKNPSRIGINYFSYGTNITRFIVNKVLFLTGVILCYVFATELLLCIAVVLLVVPAVKKIVSGFLMRVFCGEAFLIISEALLCISLGRIDIAVIFLIIYHLFDSILYVTYVSAYRKSFAGKQIFVENPVDYKYDEEGNYIFSEGEYIPLECEVISGNAVVDAGALSGKKDDFLAITAGAKLLPLYMIVKGNITAKPLCESSKSLKNAIITMYSEPRYLNNVSANRIMLISNGFLSAMLILLTLVSVMGFGDSEWVQFSYSISLLMCISPIFLFDVIFEYSYFDALSKYGIHIISPVAYDDISVIEGDKVFSEKNITSFGYYSHCLHRSEANVVITRKRKFFSFKNTLIFILFLLNIAVFFTSLITETFLFSAVSVIVTALAVVILSIIN